jgi:DNA polymerase-3 subunit alpha
MKPIVGCEFYVCEDHKDKTRKDNGYQIVLLNEKKATIIWLKCLQ